MDIVLLHVDLVAAMIHHWSLRLSGKVGINGKVANGQAIRKCLTDVKHLVCFIPVDRHAKCAPNRQA